MYRENATAMSWFLQAKVIEESQVNDYIPLLDVQRIEYIQNVSICPFTNKSVLMRKKLQSNCQLRQLSSTSAALCALSEISRTSWRENDV